MVAAEAVEARESEPARTGGKSVDAFRTTGEVAAALDLPAHVLRFWESKFPQIRPLKRGGGRRYYRPRDIDLLRRIRECLYQQGYTIRGVQKLLRDGGLKVEKPATPSDREEGGPPAVASDPATGPPQSIGIADGSSAPLRETLETVRRELLEIRALLDGLGAF